MKTYVVSVSSDGSLVLLLAEKRHQSASALFAARLGVRFHHWHTLDICHDLTLVCLDAVGSMSLLPHDKGGVVSTQFKVSSGSVFGIARRSHTVCKVYGTKNIRGRFHLSAHTERSHARSVCLTHSMMAHFACCLRHHRTLVSFRICHRRAR